MSGELGYMVDSSWWARPSGGRKYHLPDANHNPICGVRAILLDGHEDGWYWNEIEKEIRCKRCERMHTAAAPSGAGDEGNP